MRAHKSQTRVNRQAHYDGLGARIDGIVDGRDIDDLGTGELGEIRRLDREQSAHIRARMRVKLATMRREAKRVRRWDKRGYRFKYGTSTKS